MSHCPRVVCRRPHCVLIRKRGRPVCGEQNIQLKKWLYSTFEVKLHCFVDLSKINFRERMRSEGDGHRKKKAFVRAQKMLRSVSTMAQKSENNAKIFSMSRKRIPLSFVFGRNIFFVFSVRNFPILRVPFLPILILRCGMVR